MKYIDLINAFEKWLETNYLPSSSQLLWYKLIRLFNICGWSEWITVDNRRLMCIMQIESEKTFIRCRDNLIEANFFYYRKGKKGCPNQYKINTVNFTVQMTVETTVNMTVQTPVKTTGINRLRQEDKKVKKRVKSFDELIENYTQNEKLRQALKDHLPIRKRRGSLTNRAIEIGLENLTTLTKNITDKALQDEEKIKIVQKSIASGWPDYYPLRKETKNKQDEKQDVPINLQYTDDDLDGLYDNS